MTDKAPVVVPGRQESSPFLLTKSDRHALLLLVLLPLAIRLPGLIPGRLVSSADSAFFLYPWKALQQKQASQSLADMTFHAHPLLAWSAKEVKSGRFPLWNPYAYCGAPHLGAMQPALLSPFTALAYVLPFDTAVGLSLALRQALASVSMFLFLRLLAASTSAAVLGGVTFGYCGFLTVWLGWSLGGTACWMPVLFCAAELLRRTHGFRETGILAIAVAVQFTGGHPETSLHMLAALGIYAGWRAVSDRDPRFGLLFASALGLGALAAAVQLLPFAEYLSESATLAARKRTGVMFGLDPRLAILYLLPSYNCWQEGSVEWEGFNVHFNEHTGYVGLAPFVLAACAAAVRGRQGATRFFLLLALGAALALFWDVVPRALSHVPGLSLTAINRLSLVLGFAMAAVAAFGLDAVRDPPPGARRALALVATFSGILLCLYVLAHVFLYPPVANGQSSARSLGSALVMFVVFLAANVILIRRTINGRRGSVHLIIAVQVLSLFQVAAFYYPVMRTRDFFPKTPAIEYLQRHAGSQRCLLPSPNIAALYGLMSPSGYDGMNPLRISRLVEKRQALGNLGNNWLDFNLAVRDPAIDLAAVQYVYRDPEGSPPAPWYRRVYDGPDGRIFLNTRALPRAFLVPHAAETGDDEALGMICSGTFDPRRTVLLAEPPPADSPTPRSTPGKPAPDPVVEDRGPNQVLVRAGADVPSWLVLSDSWAPGWRASIDSRPARLYRANYAFRAVRLPAGSHEVAFRYLPYSFILGLIMTATGILIAGWWIAADRPRRRP